jgi:purine-cytosine permease-like protein
MKYQNANNKSNRIMLKLLKVSMIVIISAVVIPTVIFFGYALITSLDAIGTGILALFGILLVLLFLASPFMILYLYFTPPEIELFQISETVM